MRDSIELKYYKVISFVYEATRNGRLEWEDYSPFSEWRTFDVTISHISLRISEIPDLEYPDMPDYELAVVNGDSGSIESISNRIMGTKPDGLPTDAPEPYSMLKEIYKLARRQALGVDATLDEVISLLNRKNEGY